MGNVLTENDVHFLFKLTQTMPCTIQNSKHLLNKINAENAIILTLYIGLYLGCIFTDFKV